VSISFTLGLKFLNNPPAKGNISWHVFLNYKLSLPALHCYRYFDILLDLTIYTYNRTQVHLLEMEFYVQHPFALSSTNR